MKKGKIILVSISAKTSLRNDREYIQREQSDGAEVIFLVMYPREDKKISEALSFELGCRCISGLSGGEALYICGGAELCISARLHTLIFASMAGCDIIGVGDDPKIRCFCEEKGGQLI